jgi:hypothetical protein
MCAHLVGYCPFFVLFLNHAHFSPFDFGGWDPLKGFWHLQFQQTQCLIKPKHQMVGHQHPFPFAA